MAHNGFFLDAWTRARNRFVEDLTNEEQRVYSQASPEAILYDASAAEKNHQATSTTRGVVTKLQPFVEAVGQYGAALDVYSNIYPLVMGPLWGSVRVVLHLARESWKYFGKIADMFSRISDLLPRLRIYEKLFPNHEILVQSLSKIYFDVLQFCVDAKMMFRRAKHAMMTLIWKPFERQFGSHMDAFRRHQEEMEKDVSLSHMIEAADSRALIRSTQMNISKERYDHEKLGIFASLSSNVDYEAQHRKLRGSRHEGTGMWLIHHPAYIGWKQSTSSKGLFIHGIPGSGKSVLTSLIVDDHLENPKCPAQKALYFYCDYANPSTLQPIYLYRAFLQQMFFRAIMSETVVKSVVETLRINSNGLSEQKLASLVCNAIQSCAGLHVIVDGLDECEREVQQTVTSTLCHLLTNGCPLLKVLITCRDEGHLLTKFGNFGRLQITNHASAADIQSYISHAVTSSLSSGDLILRNPALKEEIVSKLVDKAQGMFLWVHFQLIELCDAASDQDIREILEHLPEGLNHTYTRIFKKIAKTASKTTVLKIMKWMVCSRRLLRVEELQEAVAFDSRDKSWSADKIPDGDKMIKSCHGLVVRDTENGIVSLAHHTVQQYLVSPQEPLAVTGSDYSEEFAAILHFWPELYNFRCNSEGAEAMIGRLCVTYLCFSDFGTALSHIQDDKRLDLTAAFKGRGPVSIPAALGLGKSLYSLPYKFFGSNDKFKMPEIDYSRYLNTKPQDRRPSADFKKKFALLEYVIEYWPWHTRWLNEPGLVLRFGNLVQHQSLGFEFRPWGPNQHFGPNGCKGCPVPDSDDLQGKDLPSIGLVHWAAETGHLKIFDIVEPPLQEYLKHERYHDETLLIACHPGQLAIVHLLLSRGKFDLSDGRAIIAACASGNASLLEYLLQEHEATSDFGKRFDLINFRAIALYQAASNGHKDIVELLLARKAGAYISDPTTGLTSLQIAAKNGHLQVIRAICTVPPHTVPPGRNMDPPHEDTGMKALHYAAVCGHDEIITLLLKHGWGCDDKDSLGETALIKASKNGQAIVAKTLLEGGANPFIKGGDNYQVLPKNVFSLINDRENEMAPRPVAAHHAAANGHNNVLALLPYSDWTCGVRAINALHLGAAYGHADVVETLLSKGARIRSKDQEGMTALHYASCGGHDLVVQSLLNRGCRLDQVTDDGLTALHFAALAAKSKTVKILVARGAVVNAKTSSQMVREPLGEWIVMQPGSTSLHLAASFADAGTVQALVECGASLDEYNVLYETPLDRAVASASPANVLALIELGANLNRYVMFSKLVWSDNCDILEILLSKLSKTIERREKENVSSMIQAVLRDCEMAKNLKGCRMLYNWEKDWRKSGFI